MNSAQTYKQTVKQWRPYFIASIIALIFSALSAFHGWYDGEFPSEELTEEEEVQQLSKDPSKVPYHDLFVKNATAIGWDWEMLAAIAYHESHFNPLASSHRGARGLMQLMPKACDRYGLNDSTVFVAEDNVRAAARCLNTIGGYFADIEDITEREKFVLAAYNAGPAHIIDARRLARKYGADANSWDDTETFLSFLKYEEYYTDPVVKYGKFNAKTTIAYVQGILRTSRMIHHGEFAMKRKRQSPSSPAVISEPQQVLEAAASVPNEGENEQPANGFEPVVSSSVEPTNNESL